MEMSLRQIHQISRQAAQKGGDPAFAAVVKRHRREGLGWRYDGLGDWSTEAIIAKLRELGVDTDASRFPDQARAAGRPAVLYDRWYPKARSRGDFWDDFPFLAAEELWRRLTPDLVCPERIADRLDPIVEGSPAGNALAAPEVVSQELAAALALMDYLETFPKEERGDRYEELRKCTMWDYEDWLLQMVCDYGPEHPDELTRIADTMADFALNAGCVQAGMAEVLGRIGRREEALRRIRANLARSPEEVQTHIRAGDAYQVMGDFDHAMEQFTAAAEMARNANDWGWAADRVTGLLEGAGREKEYDEFVRRHPCPVPAAGTRAPSRPAAAPAPVVQKVPAKPVVPKASPAPAAASPKPGQEPRGHAPCPCGSGKRYRDCCRKSR